jgi:hypothetical protein
LPPSPDAILDQTAFEPSPVREPTPLVYALQATNEPRDHSAPDRENNV